MKKVLIVFGCVIILLVGVFLIGRYGWKVMGFDVCDSVNISSVAVSDGQVHITGRQSSLFPKGCVGHCSQQEGSTLYVGFHFSGLFGFFETSDFDVIIPIDDEITQVVVKYGNNESLIWPEMKTDQNGQ